MSEIKDLQPQSIWKNFDELTKIPRPSGHLEKVQQFLVDFGRKAGVEASVDEAGNVVMIKPATPGMENRKTILLQAHMDMVPQKTPDSDHDFETDPIETYIDGEWVKAKNTTLGSDDGIGVAAIMGIMEAKDLKHGPIEALITADEETGMSGAINLPANRLKADYYLNMDTEEWGEFIIGSAGGVDITAELEYKEADTDKDSTALRITLKGLLGGHSGLEINLGRANANKLMVRVIRKAIGKCNVRLASWHGGNMRNAIPYQAETVITLPKENVDNLKNLLKEMEEGFNSQFKGIEKGITLTCEEVERPEKQIPVEIQDNLVDAIFACHNGVVRMIPSYPDIVETSSNLAIIDMENGKAVFQILTRSSREDMKEYTVEMLASCFGMAGMKVTTSGSYQGWDPNPDSEFLKVMRKAYKDLFNEEVKVNIVHAGLECSIVMVKYPGLDCISMGPTLKSPHSTNERLLISTVKPFWELVVKTLENIPEK